MKFAKYGRRELLVAVFLCVFLAALSLVIKQPLIVYLAALALGFPLFFFRDPERQPPEGSGEHELLAPADGKIVAVEEMDEEEFLNERAVRIDIFLSIFDVHINRSPFEGVVEAVRYKPGRHINALRKKAPVENESNSVLIADSNGGGRRVLVKQIAGVIARRVVCDCSVGQHLARGQRLGMIKFGSRTELYIPVKDLAKVSVEVGRKVKAGKTILGVLKCDG